MSLNPLISLDKAKTSAEAWHNSKQAWLDALTTYYRDSSKDDPSYVLVEKDKKKKKEEKINTNIAFVRAVEAWVLDLEKNKKNSAEVYAVATRCLSCANTYFNNASTLRDNEDIRNLQEAIYALDPTSHYFWLILYHVITIAFVLVSWYVVLTALELSFFEIAMQDLVINGFFLWTSIYNGIDLKDSCSSVITQCRLRQSIHAMSNSKETFFQVIEGEPTIKTIVADTCSHLYSDFKSGLANLSNKLFFRTSPSTHT